MKLSFAKLMLLFNFGDLATLKKEWQKAEPFPHVVIDNFLSQDIAEKIANDFPSKDCNFWHEYANPLEIKKTCSDWNKFTPDIYNTFFKLLSKEVSDFLSLLTEKKLVADIGLHGGGLHCHASGGKLNAHLDYSLHPKIELQRKVNIIIYVSKNWNPTWGGSLGLWGHNKEDGQPGKLMKNVECVFNRAVIFDTTMNSWHGLPDPITCPEGQSRNSLAVYYLCEPPEDVDERGKALFAPTEDQKFDEAILTLIQKRADNNFASKVYVQADVNPSQKTLLNGESLEPKR